MYRYIAAALIVSGATMVSGYLFALIGCEEKEGDDVER